MKVKLKGLITIAMTLVIISSLVGCTGTNNTKDTELSSTPISKDANDIMGDKNTSSETDQGLEDILGNKETEDSLIDTSEMISSVCTFKIIDCGQAESILISSREFAVLIDAGEETNATAIKKVLDNQGISKLDILIATHPHSDHIGGMKSIVENYDIDKIIMTPTGHTSKTYEELLLAIESKGKTINKAETGKEYSLGELKLKIIGPSELSGDLNEDSVVVLASYGETDVLLTGDAGLTAEKSYVKTLGDIEVLKVGHHGSETATSDNLLDITTPEIAAISCGADNQYGHPNQETLDKLNKRGIQIFSTETSGNIEVRTDGKEYTIETSKEGKIESTEGTENTEDTKNKEDNTSESSTNKNEIVYITEKGTKYHSTEGCSRLYTSKNIIETTKNEAINKGLDTCSRCW